MTARTLGFALCLLALWAGTAQAMRPQQVTAQRPAKPAPPQYLVVSVQPTPDKALGAGEADTAFAAGFNSLRVILPWSYPWQNDAVHDAPRICSVAAQAAVHHMSLFLDLVPTNATPPVTSTQIGQFDITLGAYMSYLFGPKGCAQGLAELDIEVANEPNYSVFWPQATAAEDYTHLLIRTWRFVHKEAAKQGYSVPVKVIGGELAASHDPVGFMDQMHDEAQSWHVHGPFFDMFSYHCYGTGGSALTLPAAVRSALVSDFGQAVPLLCSEYALPNATSQQYCQALSMSISSGLAGFAWFRLLDDPAGLPTGLYYFDPVLGQPGDQPVAKKLLTGVPALNAAALNGSLTCS